MTLAVSYLWFATILVYYALSIYCAGLSTGSAGGIYVTVFFASAVEAPAYGFSSCIADRFGRKRTLAVAMAQSAVCATIIAVLSSSGPPASGSHADDNDDDDDGAADHDDGGGGGGDGVGTLAIVGQALALVSKLFITVAVAVVYVYSSELFPTDVRALAFGTANIFARFGGLVAPFVVGPTIASVNTTLPLIVLAITALVGAVVVCGLPETKGLSLPENTTPVRPKKKSEPRAGASAMQTPK